MATVRRGGSGVASRLDQRRQSAHQTLNKSYADKQREIVHTAAGLFAEKGYDAINFLDIAAALSMDRATLYYYFKSKTHLLASAITDVLSDVVNELNAIVATEADALTKLREAIRCILTNMAEKYPFSVLYFQDDIWRSHRDAVWIAQLREDDTRVYKIFSTLIEEGQREGTIRDGATADLITRVVFGSLCWTYRWFKPGGEYDTEVVIQSFDAVFVVGLAPPGESSKARG